MTVEDFPDEKHTQEGSSEMTKQDSNPIIYISLNINKPGSASNDQREQVIFQELSKDIFEVTGLKSAIVADDTDLEEEVLGNDTVYLVQADNLEESEVSVRVYKNRIPLDMLENDEQAEARSIKNIIEETIP